MYFNKKFCIAICCAFELSTSYAGLFPSDDDQFSDCSSDEQKSCWTNETFDNLSFDLIEPVAQTPIERAPLPVPLFLNPLTLPAQTAAVQSQYQRDIAAFNETHPDFNYKESPVYQELCRIYGEHALSIRGSKAILSLVMQNTEMHAPYITHNYMPAIFAWFQDNWDAIRDHLPPPEDVMRLAQQHREQESNRNRTRAAARIADFAPKQSEAWIALSKQFCEGITLRELDSIAAVASKMARISKPDKTAKGSLPAMIKWFDENWTAIGPHLSTINLKDHVNLSGRADRRNRFARILVPEE
ncbi:MAG: hypothetical protein LBL30_00225 [Holosporales bacterium]|nr:hypothetical protein [Holosporales bacterium]